MLFNVLRNNIFRNFFIADIISCFGVGMSTIGASWYALMETGSNTTVGIVLAINVLAGFFVSPVSGIIADKYDRKTIILWTFLIRAFFVFSLAVMFIWGGFNTMYLYLFSAINGIGWSIYMATSRSFLQEILNKESIVNGNSLVEISLQIGMFSAAALAGFIYKFYSFSFILFTNCAVFILASIFLIKIPYISKVVSYEKSNYLHMFKEGFTYLLRERLILILGILSIVPLTVTMLFNVILPSHVSDTLTQTSIVFGFSDMFYGIGGLISGFVISFIASKIRYTMLALLFFFIATADLYLLSINHTVSLLYAGCLFLGLSNSSLRIVMSSIIMQFVDNKYMGRVTSVWVGISLLSQTILSLIIGRVIDQKGSALGFVIMSVIMLIGLLGFSFIYHRVTGKSSKLNNSMYRSIK